MSVQRCLQASPCLFSQDMRPAPPPCLRREQVPLPHNCSCCEAEVRVHCAYRGQYMVSHVSLLYGLAARLPPRRSWQSCCTCPGHSAPHCMRARPSIILAEHGNCHTEQIREGTMAPRRPSMSPLPNPTVNNHTTHYRLAVLGTALIRVK